MSPLVHEKAAIGFDRAGDSYERGRPEYPQEAIDFLVQALHINAGSKVLDIGAGTGKFTKLLVPLKCDITALEPIEGMRKKFSSLYPKIKIVNGTAERMPIESEQMDAAIVAQAFHWFNGPEALREIHRILKPNSKLGMIWNARDESLDWVAELTKIIDPHEGGAPRFKTMNWKKAFDHTQLFSNLQFQYFSYIQKGTFETIVDRVSSISFISALPEPKKEEVLNQVRTLLTTHPDTKDLSEIQLPYRTEFYWCQKLNS